ncbi:MAG: ComEC/Rec2 family competence protein [Bacteroidota bacterium]
MTGILLGIYLPWQIPVAPGWVWVMLAGAGGLIALGRTARSFRWQWIYGCSVHALLAVCGYALCLSKTERLHPDHFGHLDQPATQVAVRLLEPPEEKPRSVKVLAEVERVAHDSTWTSTVGRVLLYFQKDSVPLDLHYGDRLLVTTSLDTIPPPQNPAEFDYRQYLGFHQVSHRGFVRNGNWTRWQKGAGSAWFAMVYRTRNYLLNAFRDYGLSGQELAVASALVLGYKEELDQELSTAYASAGAMHVLAVSGLHVGIIFLVLNQVLFFLTRWRGGVVLKAVLLILALWLYAFLTGMSPSVMRATTMFSFIIIGQAMKRSANIYNTLAASALLLLLINPFMIMQVGFQLSYLAVLGIVYLQPIIYQWFEVHNWLLDKVWAITAVSLSAQIATFPLGLLYFHQFPSYFLFSNLIVIPAATVILYLGIALLLLSPFEVVAQGLAVVLDKVIHALNRIMQFMEHWPYAIVDGIAITISETWLIYAAMALLLAYLAIPRLVYLKWMLGTVLLLSFLQGVEHYRQDRQRMVVVYHVRNALAVDFIHGTEHAFLADSTLLASESRMLFHIKHYWWELGLRAPHLLPSMEARVEVEPMVHRSGPFVQFGPQRMALVGPEWEGRQHQHRLPCELAVITGNPRLSLAELTQVLALEEVVIDATNRPWRVAEWVAEADSLNIPCHAVARDGAFVRQWPADQ